MDLMDLCKVVNVEHIRVWDSNYNIIHDCKKDMDELLDNHGCDKISSIEPNEDDDYCIEVYLI